VFLFHILLNYIRREHLKDNRIHRQVIPRSEHNISRSKIVQNAIRVLVRLKQTGHQAYMVGGGVRDLLLEKTPKDFDIVTDARPEEVRSLFRNSRLIGRRFRLVHVHFGSEIIEVATFRGQHDGQQGDDGQIVNGMIVRDNVFGTLEEDALRRDFTVNSLYYNIDGFSIVDDVGGMADLQAGLLRLIGDPVLRYREDPVRMLRAMRFAAKLDFNLEENTEAPVYELGHLLEGVPPARLFEETLKLFFAGYAKRSFELLRHYGLLTFLFPQTEDCIEHYADGEIILHFIIRSLENTDARIAEGKSVTPAFLFAAFLWGPVIRLKCRYLERGMSESQAMSAASDAVMSGQSQHVSVPRRFHAAMRDIWAMQDRLIRRAPKRSLRLLGHPRFRAAYDFLLLRSEAGDADKNLANWWTEYQFKDEAGQQEMTDKLVRGRKHTGRRKKTAVSD